MADSERPGGSQSDDTGKGSEAPEPDVPDSGAGDSDAGDSEAGGTIDWLAVMGSPEIPVASTEPDLAKSEPHGPEPLKSEAGESESGESELAAEKRSNRGFDDDDDDKSLSTTAPDFGRETAIADSDDIR